MQPSPLLMIQPCIAPWMAMGCRIPDSEHEGLDVVDDSLLVPSADLTAATMISSSTTTSTTISSMTKTSSYSAQQQHPLDCAWMTRSYTSDEFEKLLTQEAASSTLPLSALFLPKEEEELPECMEELESFLTSFNHSNATSSSGKKATASRCAASPSSTSSAASSKRRGRPAKPLPVTLLTMPAKKSPTPAPVTPVSYRESSPEVDKYLKMRRSNNEASMKSRLRRKEKEAQNAELVARLTSENSLLKEQLAALRQEFAQLKIILEKHL
jgi:hypothetical protein